MSVRVTDRDAFIRPPCPECATKLDIEWLDAQTLGQVRPAYTPGKMTCPSGRDHDVTAAYVELGWPQELSEEDRAWLRQQRRRE